ncbi:hypothetical protein BDD43_4630 [Mucilaginibacter gracilis]|uniref:Uncharacterized protein n=1 Tax=Mucilaginibacter gracilis TaxID=423350 RepID=A0A495J5Y9_9SPHI|nr:hypothetical protein [Mucilaginibacter gracilis]RKR84395.1 hypothetical protein BDD43_4630 [Mucilaginibacter gracilis]
MKRNILNGMILIGAIALSSCSTQNKLASNQNDANDDVYSTKAVAGEQPVYAVRQDNYRQDNGDNGYDDNDYYYYDSYSARLNRFYNYSPFLSSYYDDLYYGQYSPYYSGFGLGVGFGYGYFGGGYFGYNPYSYYGGYGYNPYFNNYYGSTIGYGYSPYWGAVSYYNVARNNNTARPYRGPSVPINTTRSTIGYTNSGRGVQTYNPGGRPSGVATVNNGGNSTSYSGRQARPNSTGYQPQTTTQTQQRPQSQPQPSYTPQPSSSGSSGGSSGGGERSNGSSRPVRP